MRYHCSNSMIAGPLENPLQEGTHERLTHREDANGRVRHSTEKDGHVAISAETRYFDMMGKNRLFVQGSDGNGNYFTVNIPCNQQAFDKLREFVASIEEDTEFDWS